MTPEALARLHAAAAPDRPWSAAEFRGLLISPAVFALGDDRAMALGRVVADEAELLTIATHPDHRRGGLARGLLSAFERTARWRGARRGFLEVSDDNRAARALYASAGWREAGLRRGYYPRPDGRRADALLLAKSLDPDALASNS